MAGHDHSAEAPPLLTADEAMVVLRIGRSTIYESANRYRATGGAEGVPCVRIGRQLRFQRYALEQIIGGAIPWPLVRVDASADASPDRAVSRANPDRRDGPPTLFAVGTGLAR